MSRKRVSILAMLAAVCLIEADLQKLEGRFPAIKTFSVEQALGSWAKVQAKHFADGAIYDQTVVKR
jgi:ABC-type sulfate transport system substrate-binding protein